MASYREIRNMSLQAVPFQPLTVVVGATASILRGMFPQADAHVYAWRRHKYKVESMRDLEARDAAFRAAMRERWPDYPLNSKPRSN